MMRARFFGGVEQLAQLANAQPIHFVGAVAGGLAAVEDMFALKDLLAKYGSANLAVQGGDAFDAKLGRGSYIFNPTLAGIEQADALLIIGANPRKEAAVFNARIRKTPEQIFQEARQRIDKARQASRVLQQEGLIPLPE